MTAFVVVVVYDACHFIISQSTHGEFVVVYEMYAHVFREKGEVGGFVIGAKEVRGGEGEVLEEVGEFRAEG
jgi:hypothetical protein